MVQNIKSKYDQCPNCMSPIPKKNDITFKCKRCRQTVCPQCSHLNVCVDCMLESNDSTVLKILKTINKVVA